MRSKTYELVTFNLHARLTQNEKLLQDWSTEWKLLKHSICFDSFSVTVFEESYLNVKHAIYDSDQGKHIYLHSDWDHCFPALMSLFLQKCHLLGVYKSYIY